MSPDVALDFALRMVGVGLIIGSAELIVAVVAGSRSGLLSGRAGTVLASPDGAPPIALSSRLVIVSCIVCLGAAGLISTGGQGLLGRVAVVLALVSQLEMRRLRRYGGDGADQMASVILGAALLVAVSGPGDLGPATTIAVLFIAGQASLAYLAAGVSKAVSASWRDGSAIVDILSTTTHGTPALGRWLFSRPFLARGLSWSVIGFECMFVPLVLSGSAPLAVLAVAMAALFHLGCAFLMGLNSFVWAFPATFGCVMWVAQQLPWGP